MTDTTAKNSNKSNKSNKANKANKANTKAAPVTTVTPVTAPVTAPAAPAAPVTAPAAPVTLSADTKKQINSFVSDSIENKGKASRIVGQLMREALEHTQKVDRESIIEQGLTSLINCGKGTYALAVYNRTAQLLTRRLNATVKVTSVKKIKRVLISLPDFTSDEINGLMVFFKTNHCKKTEKPFELFSIDPIEQAVIDAEKEKRKIEKDEEKANELQNAITNKYGEENTSKFNELLTLINNDPALIDVCINALKFNEQKQTQAK